MSHVIFTVGVSASGKTTWAKEVAKRLHSDGKSCIIISRDDIRHQYCTDNNVKGYVVDGTPTHIWGVWNWKWENKIQDIWWKSIVQSIGVYDVIIIADTNLNRSRLEDTIELLRSEYGVLNTETKLFAISSNFHQGNCVIFSRADELGLS